MSDNEGTPEFQDFKSVPEFAAWLTGEAEWMRNEAAIQWAIALAEITDEDQFQHKAQQVRVIAKRIAEMLEGTAAQLETQVIVLLREEDEKENGH